jgi:hypothetical protein
MTATAYDKTNKLPSQQQLTQEEAIALLLLLLQRQQPPRKSCVSEATKIIDGIRK